MKKNNHESLKSETTRRLNIHVTEEMHHKLKILAANRYITIRELVIRSIIRYIDKEEKYD